MGIVSMFWHRNKHASWLTGLDCLAWRQQAKGWEGGNTQPGKETQLVIPTLLSVAHGILENLTLSNLKPKDIKQKSPKANILKLWSSLVLSFLNS